MQLINLDTAIQELRAKRDLHSHSTKESRARIDAYADAIVTLRSLPTHSVDSLREGEWIEILPDKSNMPKVNGYYWTIRAHSKDVSICYYDGYFVNYDGYRVMHYQLAAIPNLPRT